MSRAALAILGGYGDIGRQAARYWLRMASSPAPSAPTGPLRIGGRNLRAAQRCADALRAQALATGADSPGIECRAADFYDASSLDAFVDGCRVVLNCAGPSHAIGDRVAAAAWRAGADYVDAAGDDALYERLDPQRYLDRGRRAVLSAGLQPGLSALLPRWLAARFDRPQRLTSYFGVLDLFTDVAADDYLHGAGDGSSEPLAAWRDGRRPGALVRKRGVELPFFPAIATALPYLNREGERLARQLRLSHGDWYSLLEGRHVLAAFDRVHGLDRKQAVTALRQASLLDLAGREPHVTMLVQIDGLRDGTSVTATALLRGRSNAELTGAFAASSVAAVLRGEVSCGRHYAAMALDPQTGLHCLQAAGAITALSVFDASIESFADTEEGAL